MFTRITGRGTAARWALAALMMGLAGCAESAAPRSAPTGAKSEVAEPSARASTDQSDHFKSVGPAMAGKPAGQVSATAPPLQPEPVSAESYAHLIDNPFRNPSENPLSTFSIDVDTASYANVRRFLSSNALPPKDAVRIEELVNYFPYDYPAPKGNSPFAIDVEVARCPWDDAHLLAKVGIKGQEIDRSKRPASNLVFLLDVSGSMSDANKLPLVKQSLRLLVDQLGENDRVAIAVYAGASGLVLPPTPCHKKAEILEALERLQAGGSTNGAGGIQLAYDTAVGSFIKGGTNRVILCTDGDFNVGITSQDELTRLIEQKAKSGVFLTVLGFGMGNLKDNTIERLADKGNGNAGYIDSIKEAQKIFVEQMGATLVTIAKDVKIQVEFNPAFVSSYRLIGYENRLMKAKDFHDDTKDAGEIGAGHTVTALYELIPSNILAGKDSAADKLKYQKVAAAKELESPGRDLFHVKMRYKAPDADASQLIDFAVTVNDIDPTPTDELRFAAAVASFGMLLRDSPYKGDASWDDVLAEAEGTLGKDNGGYRHEFLELVRKAKTLQGR